MKTVKLFYKNCHLREFSARVVDCRETERGFAVILDATAFYPEGGGQACDRGTLGGVNVTDVREKEGEILHFCDGKLETGSVVAGCIDWERRFDLMQQHSGEHIVSGLVHRMLGHHNVGFHVGSDCMEIDFDGPVTQEQLAEIEWMANQAVWENLPVQCFWPGKEELPGVFYRTKKQLPWPVRIVQIPGYDSCACCGVHVTKTGEIGLIKLLSCVKFHQGVRIELVCGGRALRQMQGIYEQNRLVSQAFSAKMLATGEAARKMNEALAAEKLRANTLQSALLEKIAGEYAQKGNVWRFESGLDGGAARELADKMAAVCGGWAAVLSGGEGRYSLCIMSKCGDVRSIGQALGARGGGKNGCFQGSVTAERAAIEDILRKL